MRQIVILHIILAIVMMTSPLFGDMTTTDRTSMRAMGITISETTNLTSIKGDRSRSEELNSSDQFMMLALDNWNEKSLSIKRLDSGVCWTIYPDDSSYGEELLRYTPDTITRFQASMPGLDDEFNPKPEMPDWVLLSKTEYHDTCLGFPCMVIESSACISGEKNKGDSMIATCQFWVVSDDDYFDEAATHDQKLRDVAGLPEDYKFSIFGAILSQFNITFADLALDSLQGFPVKAEISIRAGVIGEYKNDLQPDIMADEIVSEEILESEAALMEADTGITSVETDQALKDSMYDLHKEFFEQVKTKVETGIMELTGIKYEVVNIDTTTVLPDSLFEIPTGFTKR